MNNIRSVSPEYKNSTASIVFGTDGTLTTIKTDAPSIASFGNIAERKDFRKTDATGLNNDTQAYLDTVKGEQWSFDIEVDDRKFSADS